MAIPIASPPKPCPPVTILENTESNITKVISIIGNAFVATPLLIMFVSELDKFTPDTPHETITQARRVAHFTDGITRIAKSGALFLESGNFSSVAIWEPAGFQGIDFSSGREQWGALAEEWTRKVKAARVRYLGLPGQNPAPEDVKFNSEIKLRPFWHLAFLARNPDVHSVPGAVSALVRPYIERAIKEGVPVWLEATTATGVRMYEYYGFRLVETITLGVGRVGSDGWLCEGGVGTNGYCMIYDSHLTE